MDDCDDAAHAGAGPRDCSRKSISEDWNKFEVKVGDHMKMHVFGLGFALLLSCGGFAQTAPAAVPNSPSVGGQADQDKAAKRAEIRQLIELTGAANVSADALRQIIAPLRSGFPQVPDEFWDTFLKEVRSDKLIDLVIPIYDKYYTRAEIHDLTAFYQSPVGQKTIKVLPKLSAEAIDVGQEWE